MKNRRILSTIITFLIGVLVGFGIAVLIGLITTYVDPCTLLTNHPKICGDIKVWVQKPQVNEDANVPTWLYQEQSKELWMTKDNVPFLMISQNEAGKTTALHILDKNKWEPVFFMTPLNIPGKWGQATYSKPGKFGKPIGNVLVDIDFDGCFDFKVVADANGNCISRYIFIDGSWKQVDQANIKNMKAQIGETTYIFDFNSGWKQ
jgi:hypothetical protein